MKISKIELKGYNQFNDVEISLRYPKGHPEAGKPLKKICIIGPSGTGKTSILRIIKWLISEDRYIRKNMELFLPPKSDISVLANIFNSTYKIYPDKQGFIKTEHIGVPEWMPAEKTGGTDQQTTYRDHLKKISPFLINYPAELSCEKEDYSGTPKKSLEGMGLKDHQEQSAPEIIDFSFQDMKSVWDFILKSIKEHRANELLHKKQIAETAAQDNAKLEEIENKTREYKKWLSLNPDPLKILADQCLDPILYNLGLKVKTGMDLDTILNLGFLELQSLCGQTVPRSFWSTGTTQLVLTAIPLYQLKPKDAIILVDEPERSLFPDIQKNIIDTYVQLAPGCQFFFATHSPIIASAFEPWEIVELKFDEEHKYVYRNLHYDGEDHVDNYKYFPEYLRWDSILKRIFDLDEEGGDKRLDALEELVEVRAQIKKLKENKKLKSGEGRELTKRCLELARKLDWQFDDGGYEKNR